MHGCIACIAFLCKQELHVMQKGAKEHKRCGKGLIPCVPPPKGAQKGGRPLDWVLLLLLFGRMGPLCSKGKKWKVWEIPSNTPVLSPFCNRESHVFHPCKRGNKEIVRESCTWILDPLIPPLWLFWGFGPKWPKMTQISKTPRQLQNTECVTSFCMKRYISKMT